MIDINVKNNIKEFSRSLSRFQRKQVPFATAGALTSTAFDVRKEIVEKTWGRSFKVRSKPFPKALFHVERAKAPWKLTASVVQVLDRDFVGRHVTGGTKRATSTGNLAIPLDQKLVKRKRKRLVRGEFIEIKSGGNTYLAKRKGRKRALEFLYTLKPSAVIKKRFPFFTDAERIVRFRLKAHWDKSIQWALDHPKR